MESIAELRAEARRLKGAIKDISDPELKKELTKRALGLAERAEAMAGMSENPEIIRMNISYYKSKLAAGISEAPQKRIIEEMLADLEALLADLREKAK